MSGDVKLTRTQAAVLQIATARERVAPKFRQEKMFERLEAAGYLKRTHFGVWIAYAITPAGLAALTKAKSLKSEEI